MGWFSDRMARRVHSNNGYLPQEYSRLCMCRGCWDHYAELEKRKTVTTASGGPLSGSGHYFCAVCGKDIAALLNCDCPSGYSASFRASFNGPSPGGGGGGGGSTNSVNFATGGVVSASGAAPVAPKFGGMSGFAEQLEPEDWDTAAGTVRGYRWFRIDVPESWLGVRKHSVREGYFNVNGKPEVSYEEPRVLSDEELPDLTGAFNGTWGDGKLEAVCRKGALVPSFAESGDITHQPPETRVACGCGFWAYWDPNIAVSTVMGDWSCTSTPRSKSVAVFAAVEGSGRAVIGDKGFRSQYARIEALAIGACSLSKMQWWYGDRVTEPQFNSAWLRGEPNWDKVQASDTEVQYRVAMVEDMLQRKYPGARVVGSQKTLSGLYPPDKNYGQGAPDGE